MHWYVKSLVQANEETTQKITVHAKCVKLAINIDDYEKEVVWLGDIFWKGSMEFSSHRDFITPNVSAADCYLRQWYDYKECVHC